MNTRQNKWKAIVGGALLGLLASSASGQWLPTHSTVEATQAKTAFSTERRLILPEGKVLVLPAAGDEISLRDARAKTSRAWAIPEVRRGASMTLLPSGRVLIWGGQDRTGNLQPGGILIDPDLKAMSLLVDTEIAPRAGHSATVLTNGLVLFAGGRKTSRFQVWDESSNEVIPVADGPAPAQGHLAELQADGKVRLSGVKGPGSDNAPVLFDPESNTFESREGPGSTPPPGLAASLPRQGEMDVLTTARLSVRFAQRIRFGDLTEANVTLIGPGGASSIRVTPAEHGRLVFVTPRQELFPGAAYTLLINGVHTIQDRSVPLIAVDFSTASSSSDEVEVATEVPAKPSSLPARTYCDGKKSIAMPCQSRATIKDGIWRPGQDSTAGRWRATGRPSAPKAPDIIAQLSEIAGITAVAGQVQQVDGVPVANVEVSIGSVSTRTRADGGFTLVNVPAGRRELYVDGTSASTGGREYGQFVVGVDVVPKRLTRLPFTMYIPRISTRDKMRISSPTTRDVSLTHPDMPGLMVHVPKGTVFRDRKGRIVRELALVPTPVNRAPFPVAENYPMYFTIEPGGAVVQGLSPESATGIKIFYPNYDRHATGTQADFWIYDPAEGWRVYGKGRVTTDGRVFAPEAGVALHQTMGGSYYQIGNGEDASEEDVPPECQQCGEGNAGTGSNATAGDPIDLHSGRFSYAETDIAVRDVVPISLGRNYRPFDRSTRDFGVGTSSNYHYRIFAPHGTLSTIKLVLPSGVPLRFERTSGTGQQGVWRHFGTTSASGATLQRVGDKYVVSMPDGTMMAFSSYGSFALNWMQDRHGNRTEFVQDGGLLSKIVSPSGRWIEFDRDNQNRIVEAWDSAGNTWLYQYGMHGHLSKVVYPDESEKLYAYDAVGYNSEGQPWHRWLTEVTDRRGNRLLKNEYGSGNHADPNYGKVVKQTLADGAIYEMDYAHQVGGVTGVLVTHPDASQRRVVFDPNSKYPISDTLAYGTPLQQTFTFERDGYGRLTARTDPLGRRTEYSYNRSSQATKILRLAGTGDAVEQAFTYDSENQLASMKNSLGHEVVLQHENGCVSRITNALGKHTHMSCNAAGQTTGVTDALGNQVALHYEDHDLVAVVNPMGRSLQFKHDQLGRVVSVSGGKGKIFWQEHDAEGRVVKVRDAFDRVTERAYDANGNVTAVLMPHGNGITYVYDSRDRLIERTDSLDQTESWTYDTMNRLVSYTDRKGQTTTHDYDALGRLTVTTYQDASTVSADYDAGNRLLSLTDTKSGTLGWIYDDLDLIVQSISPQGNISYEYDDAGRRTSMTVGSQPRIDYVYDAGDRLQRVTQGSELYDFYYDDADRLVERSFPNGIQAGYAYNAASQLTGIAWLKPDATLLHDLGYGYDNLGRPAAQSGSLASQLLPSAMAGSTFDDNNRQTNYDGHSLSYDSNGNLVGDGVRTYEWDARNQLVEIKQGAVTVSSFGYDALGRRYAKTEGGVAVEYLHDGSDPVQEKRGTAIEPVLTGIGIDERNAKGSGAGRHYFLNDGLGSTRLLTDATGAVVNRYDYDPYGGTQQTNSAVQNAYQYTGREKDESGLHYYRARYYSSEMARFISEDPLHLAAGDNNLYAYVAGDPISYIDPTGELGFPGLLVGLVIGGISGALGAYVNGGNVWKGAIGGAAIGAFVGMTGTYFMGTSAAVAVRTMTGAAGNLVGQIGNMDRPCWKFNWPSFAGSALSGAAGFISPAAMGTSFTGSLASQFAQRGISGLPAASASLTGNIVATQIGKATMSKSCECL